MIHPFNCEKSKLISGLLYISKKLIDSEIRPDIYHVFKIMYFADKKSLKTFYQTVFGGFCAMPYGPVQDELYQVIKYYRRHTSECVEFSIRDNKNIVPLLDYDPDELSETDIICLDESISENAKLSFDDLYNKSHDSAWEHTPSGYSMNLFDIAQSSDLDADEIEYLKEIAQNSTLISE